MAEQNETATHTLQPGSGGCFVIYNGNKDVKVYEPGFITHIRSNAIGKRMNFAKPGCLEDLVFAVLGALPWLTISEVEEIVGESGGYVFPPPRRVGIYIYIRREN